LPASLSIADINQEDFAFGLRWYLKNNLALRLVANDSLVYMWPSNSSRPGFEGKVEMLATALQINAGLLLDLRGTVEEGQALVMVMEEENPNDEDLHYVCKSLPIDSAHEGVNLQTVMRPYPGSQNAAPVGTVDVTAGPIDGHIVLRWSLSMVEPFRVGGIHIHTGTSCEDADLVGNHFYRVTTGDPWNTVQWSTGNGGDASGFATVNTGYSASENAGRVVVVHSADGPRIGCGVLTNTYGAADPILNNASVPGPNSGQDSSAGTAAALEPERPAKYVSTQCSR